MLDINTEFEKSNPLSALLLIFGVKFDAEVWVLKPTIESAADKKVYLDWSSYACRGSKVYLSEKYLLILKRIAGCLLVGVGVNKNTPSTIKTKVYMISAFLAEAQRAGEYELSIITARKAQSIFASMCESASRGKKLSASTLTSRMNAIRLLYYLNVKVGSGLAVDPFPPLQQRRVQKDGRDKAFWEAPPEPVALHILKRAIEIVEDLGPDIERIFAKYFSAIQEAIIHGHKTRKKISPYGKKAISGEAFSQCGRLPELKSFSACDPLHLAYLRKQLVTACFIVISYTVGARVSEIRRATSTSVRSVQHSSGETFEYYHAPRSKRNFRLNTKLNDQISGEVPWVISPAATTAFKVLKQLTRPYREVVGIDSLWLVTGGNSLMAFDLSKKPSILSSSQFNSRLTEFSAFIDLEKATGWAGRLHTHQGRKHFARFAAKRDRRNLADLAIQFSHATPYSVDYSYAQPDGEFKRIIAEELSDEIDSVAQTLRGINPDRVFTGAGGGERLTQVKKFLGRLVSTKDVKKLLAKGTILVPCDWGVCLYRQETSACDGAKEHPNPIKRSPSVCVGCSNFISTKNNRSWWERYISDSVKLLKQNNISDQARSLLEQRLKEGMRVLDSLSEEI
ncbi:hypothetical protein [Pseudomonas putida]|uniref:hypothetical protein n=1 Tax=Pseudomonas putida TaxID=303 RepID=UPI002B241AE8|nr:hypothetical protein [Pseudomonas putida]